MRIQSLAILLLTLIIIQSPSALHAEETAEIRARRLINALGCKGCHKLEGNGGSLAPILDKIGSRMTRDQIRKHLAAHSESRKNGFMPSYKTTSPAELTDISDFLYNLH